MTWLTWRQFRAQLFVALAGLAALTIVVAITGAGIVDDYNAVVAACATTGDCSHAGAILLGTDIQLQLALAIVVLVVPILVGMFWGAPLIARELEAGTNRLAWTQSVTRTRWLATKTGMVGLASVVVAGFVSLLVTWWFGPLDRVSMNQFFDFDTRGIVALGYAAFAFALGVLAGALIRRTVPAMATTLFGFVAVRVAFLTFVRPLLITPLHQTLALASAPGLGYGAIGLGNQMTLLPGAPNLPNAWIYSIRIVDQGGNGLSPQFVAVTCPGLGTSFGQAVQTPPSPDQLLHACAVKLGTTFHELATYQPAATYWIFQGLELAIFLGFAILLLGLTFVWIRRRAA